MRKIYPLLIAFLLLYSSGIFAQTDPVQAKAIVVKRMIELNHISPRPVDDSFSMVLFRSVLKMTDRRRLLFTASEYKSLAAFSATLDDELRGNGWAFLKLFESTYKRSLLRADSIINRLLQKPFDFSGSETITSSREETFNFATDLTALSARWSKYLKYKALNLLYEMAQRDTSEKATLKNSITQSEAKVREQVKLAEVSILKKMLDHPAGFTDYVAQLYLNAIASGFDPHTNYFSTEEKEKFKEQLSTEALSFGLSLHETERGEIVIQKLTPGGPAWKSGDLNEGDELLSLQWEGKEAKNVAGLSLEDVYDIFDQADDKRLVFEFRKKDGTKRIVLLRKEKIENEENIVKGFVLKGSKKIGYILLPAFYTQWENESGSSCANDVAKEIVKLKKENIEGLILDVRYNGGGSLGEALQLIGIFVDEGPIMGEKHREGKVMYLKDPNRGTIYSGPMALMVNGQSASASEILAASLQDYNRALIIGSNTFGKATMQQMMALDTISSKPGQITHAKDIVKITVGKLYRLSGETAQLNGVTPDIILPDAFDGLDYREKFLPYALTADKVTKNAYYKPLTSLPAGELAKKSQERVNASPGFQDIKKITGAIRNRRTTPETVSLNADAFEQWAKFREQELNSIKGDASAKTNLFTVDNHGSDKALMSGNVYPKEINDGWLASIAADIYIQETFAVLADFILLQQTKN